MIRGIIKEAMKLRKVKQKDLAKHIDLASSSMSQFLNGKMNLGQEKIEMIFEFLRIKLVIEE